MNAASRTEEHLDRAEITDRVSRLGACLDEGRFGELGSLFVDDATVTTPGGTARGRQALVAQAERNHRPEYASQHLSSNVLVQLDGDRATVRGNVLVHLAPLPAVAPPTRPLAPTLGFVLGEVYRIECARTPDGWRFTRLETVPVWMSGERPEPRPALSPS